MKSPFLAPRQSAILRDLIREYVRTGKPVGSKRLAALNREKLCSATIRNVVAELEQDGFVSQPHTSAGRVPTANGYSIYVKSLVRLRELSGLDVNWIRETLAAQSDPGELMTRVSQILSSLSDQVGFVVAPSMSMAKIRQIEFISLAPKKILVILISTAGFVQSKLIRVDENFSGSELEAAGRYLTAHYAGKTLDQIRAEMLYLMSVEKAHYDRILHNVIVLGSASLISEEAELSDLYLGGTTTMIENFGDCDLDQLTALFQAFEEKGRLIKIVNACIEFKEPGTHVTIGLEDHFPGGRDFSVVSSSYKWGSGEGTLGVLGHRRMEYEKAISVVDCVARLCCQVMGDGENSSTSWTHE